MTSLQNYLRQHGKSYTLERERIYKFIEKHMHQHFDAQSLYDEMGKKEKVSRASVFRAVALFEEINLIRRIDYVDGHAVFEIYDPEEHHEHMTCKDCSDVIEFDDEPVHDVLEKIAEDYGFAMTNHNLRIVGVCKKCQK